MRVGYDEPSLTADGVCHCLSIEPLKQRNNGKSVGCHQSFCSLAIWLESPEKVGGTACVADLKRNFYSFQNIAKKNQRASSS